VTSLATLSFFTGKWDKMDLQNSVLDIKSKQFGMDTSKE
jgi:hypothetical protein